MFLSVQQQLQDGVVRQHMSAFAVTLGMMNLGLTIGWVSPALPKLLSDGSPLHETLTHADISWIGSLGFFCMLLSSLPAGRLIDHFGRKSTLLTLSALPVGSWLCICFGNNIYWLYSARVLSGLWGGICHTVIPVYIGEIAEPKIRGTLAAYSSVMNNIGALIPIVVGPYISYIALATTCLVLTTLSAATLFLIPETPYYYAMCNNSNHAFYALNWLRGQRADVATELEAIKQSVEDQMKNRIQFGDIVRTRGSRRALFIVETMIILQRVNGIGPLKTYGSIMLPDIRFLDPNECLIMLSITWIVAGGVAIYFTDRFSRKGLLMVTSIGGVMAMLAASSWFYLSEATSVDVTFCNYVPFALFIVHGFLINIGITPTANSLKGELFPANIRGYASSISTITMAGTGFVANRIFFPVADGVGMYANCWIYAMSCLLVLLFMPFCLIETKGRTLQEIQDKLNRVI